MRVSQAEKDRSHARIVAGAARLARERGIESTSVADVMGDAGFTNGGFYRHFDNKDALMAAAIEAAFEDIMGIVEARLNLESPRTVIADYEAHYLTEGHVRSPGIGCPVAALAGDVARASATLKQSFGAGVNRVIAAIAKGLPGSTDDQRVAAARRLAMMAGAVMIARASDPETAASVLAACRSEKTEASTKLTA